MLLDVTIRLTVPDSWSEFSGPEIRQNMSDLLIAESRQSLNTALLSHLLSLKETKPSSKLTGLYEATTKSLRESIDIMRGARIRGDIVINPVE